MCRSSGAARRERCPARRPIPGRRRRRAVDHVDRAHELVAVRDRGDDLVRGRGADRRDRLVVRRLRERDEQLVILEVDGQREPLPGHIGREQRWRLLVDRRLQEVDERNTELLGERRRQVLGSDQAELEQHGGQRLIRSLGLFDRVLEAVTREHVTLDERLSEAANLVHEHRGPPKGRKQSPRGYRPDRPAPETLYIRLRPPALHRPDNAIGNPGLRICAWLYMRLRPPALHRPDNAIGNPGLRICAWLYIRLRPPALHRPDNAIGNPGLRICAWLYMRLRPPALHRPDNAIGNPGLRICAWLSCGPGYMTTRKISSRDVKPIPTLRRPSLLSVSIPCITAVFWRSSVDRRSMIRRSISSDRSITSWSAKRPL